MYEYEKDPDVLVQDERERDEQSFGRLGVGGEMERTTRLISERTRRIGKKVDARQATDVMENFTKG